MQDKWVLVFHKEGFQLPVPSPCWEMIENANVCLRFPFSTTETNSLSDYLLSPQYLSYLAVELFYLPPYSRLYIRVSHSAKQRQILSVITFCCPSTYLTWLLSCSTSLPTLRLYSCSPFSTTKTNSLSHDFLLPRNLSYLAVEFLYLHPYSRL